MNSRTWLAAFFATLFAYGGVVGYFATLDRDPPRATAFVFVIATEVLVYLWYYFDADENHYKRTPLLGGSVMLISGIAVPYYLVRSRQNGRKLRALLKFFGILVLSVLAVVAGSLPFLLLHSGA